MFFLLMYLHVLYVSGLVRAAWVTFSLLAGSETEPRDWSLKSKKPCITLLLGFPSSQAFLYSGGTQMWDVWLICTCCLQQQ